MSVTLTDLSPYTRADWPKIIFSPNRRKGGEGWSVSVTDMILLRSKQLRVLYPKLNSINTPIIIPNRTSRRKCPEPPPEAE